MKKTTNILALNSGEPNPADAPIVIRDAAKTILTSINSISDFLEEPLKSKFLDVKGQLNTMLAGMPATDGVPAALEGNSILRNLLYTLMSAQSMMAGLAEITKTARGELVAARNSIPGEVDKGIKAKVDAGEYVTKDVLTTKINDAVTAARTLWDNTQKLIGQRRQVLATASIPVPGDDVLGAEDKDFTPAQDRAKNRVEQLKGFKLQEGEMLALCWGAPDAEFDRTLNILKANASATAATPPAAKPAGGSPFATPTKSQNDKEDKRTPRQKMGAI